MVAQDFAAAYVFEYAEHLVQALPDAAPDIENTLIPAVTHTHDQCVDRVLDVDVIADHRSVSPDLYRLCANDLIDESGNRSLSPGPLPFSERIAQSEDEKTQIVQEFEETEILFDREL